MHAIPKAWLESPACTPMVPVQDRDPRAYQVYLGNVGGSTSSFLASTPERLYVRSGRYMASEAVAATRPRGAPGGCMQAMSCSCRSQLCKAAA